MDTNRTRGILWIFVAAALVVAGCGGGTAGSSTPDDEALSKGELDGLPEGGFVGLTLFNSDGFGKWTDAGAQFLADIAPKNTRFPFTRDYPLDQCVGPAYWPEDIPKPESNKPRFLDAGPSVTLAADTFQVELQREDLGEQSLAYGLQQDVEPPVGSGGREYQIVTSGGPDIAAGNLAKLSVPAEAKVIDYTLTSLKWEKSSGRLVMVVLLDQDSSWFCRVRDDGEHTIPASILQDYDEGGTAFFVVEHVRYHDLNGNRVSLMGGVGFGWNFSANGSPL